MKRDYTGSCHCGAMRFEVSLELDLEAIPVQRVHGSTLE